MLQLELYVWILMELPPTKKGISVELLYFLPGSPLEICGVNLVYWPNLS